MKTDSTLVILGAGRGQVGLARAAKELGARVCVVTLPGSRLPAAAFADEVVFADITDPTAVLESLAGVEIDGVATSCLDKGMQSLGRVRDARHLVGPTEAAASRCNNKAAMKRALAEAGVNTARFALAYSFEELLEASEQIGFPVVAKALDLNGSMGVRVCQDRQELEDAYEFISTVSKSDCVLVEEFLRGLEIGAQSMVCNGSVLFVLPHGDQMHPEFPTVPIGHTVPLELPTDVLDSIEPQVKAAIEALGLEDCAVNVDLMLSGDDVKVIELTGRVGANGLPELLSSYLGIDYYEMVARLALGEDVSCYFDLPVGDVAVGTRMLQSDVDGVVVNLGADRELVDECDFFVSLGDEVHAFENSSHCIGQAVVKNRDLAAVLERLDLLEESLSIEVISR